MKQVLGVDVRPAVVKEPVLNVPAIDMTDSATRATKISASGGRKSAKRSAPKPKQPSRATPATTQQKRTRDGSVGQDIFEQVTALIKQGKNKSEAFAQIATDTGRNAGTVSANYYRVARASSALKPRKRTAKAVSAVSTRKAPAVRRVRPAANGSVDQITAELVRNVQALAKAVQDQEREVKQLRGRLEKMRGLLG